MNLVIQPSWQTKSSLRLLRGGCHLVHLYAKTPTYGVLILIIYRKMMEMIICVGQMILRHSYKV